MMRFLVILFFMMFFSVGAQAFSYRCGGDPPLSDDIIENSSYIGKFKVIDHWKSPSDEYWRFSVEIVDLYYGVPPLVGTIHVNNGYYGTLASGYKIGTVQELILDEFKHGITGKVYKENLELCGGIRDNVWEQLRNGDYKYMAYYRKSIYVLSFLLLVVLGMLARKGMVALRKYAMK